MALCDAAKEGMLTPGFVALLGVALRDFDI